MLTRKQYELLMFIHERIRETGIPPSFDEMKEALDLKSKSGIHRLITALEERGFLRRMEKRARALEVLKLPDNMAETLRPATTSSQAQRAPAIRHGRGHDVRAPQPRRSGAGASSSRTKPWYCRRRSQGSCRAWRPRVAASACGCCSSVQTFSATAGSNCSRSSMTRAIACRRS